MEKVVVNAQSRRQLTGKNKIKGLRNIGMVPGVLYANGNSIPIQVTTKELSGVMKEYGESAILQLSMEGKEQQVFIKEVQRDPVKNELVHFDLQPIAMNETMQLHVPIQIEGLNGIEQRGGIVQRQLNEIEIEALPNDIPKSIEIDISDLDIGDSLQVEEINPPSGVNILTSPEEIILSISQPMLQEDSEEDVDIPVEVSKVE